MSVTSKRIAAAPTLFHPARSMPQLYHGNLMHEPAVTDEPIPSYGVRNVLFPKRGLSGTEILIAANVVVAAVLLFLWRDRYGPILLEHAVRWWREVRAEGAYGWWVATMFLHVDAGHLVRNLLALLAGAGAVEFLMGRLAVLGVYLATGLAGAWASYEGHGSPPLSIGASGAVFGLLGCAVAFVVRRRGGFNYAHRWKVWRVYVPLFLVLFLPALVKADLHAHVGGFAAGVVLGTLLPPHRRVAELARFDPLTDEEEGAPDGGSGDER